MTRYPFRYQPKLGFSAVKGLRRVTTYLATHLVPGVMPEMWADRAKIKSLTKGLDAGSPASHTPIHMVPLRIIVLLTGTFLSQDAPRQQRSLDLPSYESFFKSVLRLTIAPPLDGRATLNGQATNIIQPSLEDALGITAEEAQLLRSIAADCAGQLRAIDLAVPPLVQELRFEALAEEPKSESISRRYDELNRQRKQTILDHIQKIESRAWRGAISTD